MSRGRALLALQEQDERIAALRREIADLESALSRDTELERLREAATDAEAGHRAAEQVAQGVERELAGLRRRARSLQARLYDGSVRNPQDLLGMQRDLDAMKPRTDELEASLLEAMEATEAAEALLLEARSVAARREDDRRSLEGPRRRRLAAAGDELAAAEPARAATAAAVDPGDLRIYDKVASRRHPAVVLLEGDNCGGCHLPLAVREVSEARHGQGLVQCTRCDRVVTR